MSQKEIDYLAISFSTYLRILSDKSCDASDCANNATEMVKDIIRKYPKIRDVLIEMELSDILNILNINARG